MLILRCAWHRKEFGYAKLLGITWTRSWGVSDGMCRACADVQRARYGLKRAASPSVGREVWRLTVGLTALVAWALVALLAGCGREESPRSLGYYSNATTWCSYEDERHGRAMSMAEWQTSGCACARGVGPLDTNHYHRRVVAWACPR